MTKTIRNLTFLVMALGAMTMSLSAQDLSSQRGESQNLGGLYGEKLDHGGLVINPTPQSVKMLRAMPIDITGGVTLTGKAEEFASDIDFLKQNPAPAKSKKSKKKPVIEGLTLGVEYGAEVLTAEEVTLKSGAYTLAIEASGISIKAYDKLGAFYAIQTLRQVFESPISAEGKLPTLSIMDWPDLQYRGVVEGFYGTPWSHEVRLSLIDTYGRYKMNYYIYGPKDDPYHSSPYWREPYPAEEAENIRQLVEACRRNRVNFVWAIHPGQDIRWDEEDYGNLLHKFEYMYDLGVRAFAIHFDDISGEGAKPTYQIALLNRLNEEFVTCRGDVSPLIVCPTDYTRLWANPTSRGSLVQYGNELHPSVDIFWTGDAVCSDLTEETVAWVSERVQRPILFWWNYPVTDYVRHILLQAPVYGLTPTMTADKVRGIVSNPMEHGEASKLALYSVADYAWNTQAYNPIDSWERALAVMAPDVKEAYRTFAIHSCDTETGYRRMESWETETFTMDTYTPQLADKLLAECAAIEAVPEQMEGCDNKALLAELRPWLVEFGKLGARCRRAIEIFELYNNARYNDFWNAYVDNLMTPDEVEAYNAHSSGTMKLQPFYRNLMDDMAARFYETLSGNKAAVLKASGTYPSLQAPQAQLMFDNDTATYYHSGAGQRTGHYVAVDMGFVQEVKHLHIIQGRNSVDDVDYYDHAIIEYSLDGNVWTALSDTLVGVYDIIWKGDAVEARYVRLRKLPSTKTNWLAVRSFEINPVEKSLYHIDRNPYTALTSTSAVDVEIPVGTTRCVVLMGVITPATSPTCRLYNSDGALLQTVDVHSSLLELDTAEATILRIDGVDTIYEIIPIQ